MSILIAFSHVVQSKNNTPEIQTGAADKRIHIGIRANRGAAKAIKRWQPTIDYLSKAINGYHFKIIPYELNSALNQAASRNEFQFFLTNPASYIELEHRYAAHHLLTLGNKREGKDYTQFGTVIFTHKNRKNINDIHDLKGKTFMAVDELGFGGWRIAWHEMLEHHFDPYQDLSKLTFSGGIQQKVVYAVLNMDVDAGSVRTDMLERMAAAGNISLNNIKVIHQKHVEGFPFFLSSKLYPEWPFAALKDTDKILVGKVVQALLTIKSDDIAAMKGKYVKWHMSLNYEPVRTLLKELKTGPYQQASYSFLEFLSEYWFWSLLILTVVIILSTLLTQLRITNKQLFQTEQSLLATNRSLKDLTLIDSLTGLGNRRKLHDYFELTWGQLCREHTKICILLMDIDYFKNYNDNHGHIAGDKCLKQVAYAIKDIFRRSDEFCIRYGGEEFLIVCRHCDIHIIKQRTDEFHKVIEQLKIRHAASPVSSILTLSIGVAQTIANKNIKPEDLIKQADIALYLAKGAGRNQTIVYNEQEVS